MHSSSNYVGILKDKPTYKYVIDKDLDLDEILLDNIKPGTNAIKPRFIVTWKSKKAAVSSWVSAKRTRSYPYTRIYETLSQNGITKITIIPVVKDEGKDGDRDFIAWDTFSICSYVGVYVIPAYYISAEQNPRYKNKVTNQEFDLDYVRNKIKSIFETDLGPKEWNDNERNSLGNLADLVISGYQKIHKETGVPFHNFDSLRTKLYNMKEPKSYKFLSQKQSTEAQQREKTTIQLSEETFGLTKGEVTLTDAKGGYYPWTVDAVFRHKNLVFLMEMKHSKEEWPKMSDIKDALFKFHFYGNLADLKDENGTKLEPIPTLVLTSDVLGGVCFTLCPYFRPESRVSSSCINGECDETTLNSINRSTGLIQNDMNIQKVFQEAYANNILVIALGKKNTKKELIKEILSSCIKHKNKI